MLVIHDPLQPGDHVRVVLGHVGRFAGVGGKVVEFDRSWLLVRRLGGGAEVAADRLPVPDPNALLAALAGGLAVEERPRILGLAE